MKLLTLLATHPFQRQFIHKDKDSLGRETTYAYAGNRLSTIVYPEGNKEVYDYDAFGNITSKTLKAKPNSELSDIVFNAYYDKSCDGIKCFRPTHTIDANGNRIDYTFDPDHGGLLTKTEHENVSGTKRYTVNEYTESSAGIYRLASTSVYGTDQKDTKDEQITQYTYWNDTKLPETITKTNGADSASETITYRYDTAGRVIEVDGPLNGASDAVYYRYDLSGRKSWEIGALNQQGFRVANKFVYRTQDDQISRQQIGVVEKHDDTSLMLSRQVDFEFNTLGLNDVIKTRSSSELLTVTQIDYDNSNRKLCQTVRMNPQAFNSLPDSACTLGDTGDNGPDRITKYFYNAADQITKTISGYATDDAGIDIEIGYTQNSQVDWRKDGNNNQTDYAYDGVDRLERTTFPDSSYEEFSYDDNANITTHRKRDGKQLNHTYNELNLKATTTISGEPTISYGYDAAGREDSITRGDSTVSKTYDDLGRLATATRDEKTVSYLYDEASRLSRLTYPDNFYVTYTYDASNVVTAIKENGTTELVGYTYNRDGQLTGISRENGINSTLTPDSLGRVGSYQHGNLNTSTFGFNAASQVIESTVSNEAFQIAMPETGEKIATPNDLNQYTSVGNQSLGYDNAGNLTSFDGWTYQYDAHNRLTSASKTGVSLSLNYDSVGRLATTTVNDAEIMYVYDGDSLIAEYDSEGNMLNRYVHGLGVDDPLVRYQGTSIESPQFLWLIRKAQLLLKLAVQGTSLQFILTVHLVNR